MLSARRNLALAVTERAILAVETAPAGGRRIVSRTVELTFSDGADLAQAGKLGEALRHALRRGGISTSRCVIGLPAAWITCREKLLPATDAESLRGALAIVAEREFASGPQELIFDYSQSPAAGGLSVLLMAAGRQMTETLAAVARSAGLTPTAMTSTTLALALATNGPADAGRLVVCLLPAGAELAAVSAGHVRLIRHVPIGSYESGHWVDELAGELRRIISLAPGGLDSAPKWELLVWNAAGLDDSAVKALGPRLALPLRIGNPGSDLTSVAAGTTNGRFAPAAALAGLAGQKQPIDFLHSRLAPRRATRLGRRTVWAAAAAVALLAAGVFFLLDWRAGQRGIASLRAQIDSMKADVREAGDLADNVSFAQGWYGGRPKIPDCLKEITLAFPEEGRTWATNLVVREDMQVLLSGKATGESAALELLDRLRASRACSHVKPLYIRQASGNSKAAAFAVGLEVRPAPPAPSPSKGVSRGGSR